MSVKVIEATRKKQPTLTLPMMQKRVAVYARVSTESEEQETSFEAQQAHYRSVVAAHPDWTLVDIYADEESGLTAQNRENFSRMIDDAMQGKFELILTKSISRFARNTLDCLNYIRKLKAQSVAVQFEKESINTMDASGELLLTILASIAQQESASISQNVTLGVKYRFAEGIVGAGHYNLLGMKREKNGTLSIREEEAPIVRKIFRDYIDGISLGEIGESLYGTVTHTGERCWSRSTLFYILRNEKYAGDLLLQKYYTADYLTKDRRRNGGEVPSYYVDNAHPPIIPKDVFQLAQTVKRTRTYKGMPFSGKIYCGCCGKKFSLLRGGPYQYWRCQGKAKCSCPSVRCEDMEQAVIEAMNQLPCYEVKLAGLCERVQNAIDEADKLIREHTGKDQGDDTSVSEIRRRRVEYLELEYHVLFLLQRISLIEWKKAKEQPENGICSTMEEFIERTPVNAQMGLVRNLSSDDVIRYVEKILVMPDTIEVRFKAQIGIVVEIEQSELCAAE